MRSWHYVAIFVVVVAVIGGLIFHNAQTIDDINSETVDIKDSASGMQEEDMSGDAQKEIDVMNDVDFEADALDAALEEDLSDLDNLDDLFADSVVAF